MYLSKGPASPLPSTSLRHQSRAAQRAVPRSTPRSPTCDQHVWFSLMSNACFNEGCDLSTRRSPRSSSFLVFFAYHEARLRNQFCSSLARAPLPALRASISTEQRFAAPMTSHIQSTPRSACSSIRPQPPTRQSLRITGWTWSSSAHSAQPTFQ